MSTSPNALDAVMDEASAAAEQFQPNVNALQTQSGAVQAAPASQGLAKPSMDQFLDAGGMDVDTYFRVKPDGFRIGDEMKGLLDEVIVEINMREVVPIYSARFETNGNTRFEKSYDGVTTPNGQNFQQTVDRLEKINQKSSGIYSTAEIPCVLVDDVKDPKKDSNVVIKSGTRVGLTPSVTGFKSYQSFARELRAQDPSLLSDTLKVKITHRVRKNSRNNEWGVVDFELVQE